MDFDSLTRIGETIIRSVLSQDTTEYIEIVTPDCELSETLPVNADGASKRTTAHGPIDIGFRTRAMYKWLQGGKLHQPGINVDVKRAVRQPYGPKVTEKQRNIRDCSSVTITWGRAFMRLEDKCYVNDEGVIGAIDRVAIPPEDASDPLYLADRNALLSDGKSRINPSNVRPPVLDFSFCDVGNIIDILRTKPAHGKLHKRAQIYVAKVEKVDDRNAVFNPNSAQESESRILIRARNRRGEEEAYEFTATEAQTDFVNKGRNEAAVDEGADLIQSLGKEMASKYTADSIRLSNNAIPDVERIVPVLRNLVADSILTVTWIDLSCNRITSVPPSIEKLQALSHLYLHSNQISDWQHVRTVRKALPKLTTVTFFGNPIATTNTDYKQIALSILLHLPPGGAPLKSLDFVALSAQDRHVTMMYEQFHPPPEKKRENAQRIRECTARLQATVFDF